MSTVIEIIVAHYNGSAFIGDQLSSIQANVLPDGVELKVSVLDDCSTTAEFEKLLVTTSRWTNIEVLRNDHNLGVIRTFEKGLQHSKAPYVMLCDQDDVWLPNKISLTLKKLTEIEQDQPTLVFTDLTTVDQKLNTISPRMLGVEQFVADNEKHQLLFQNVVTGCTVMLNRKLIENALPFPPSIPMHDHWLAVCAAFIGRIGYVNAPTLLYRQHSANLVGQPQRKLSSRLGKPFRTFAQFNKGLALKAYQALELSRRLPANSDRALVEQVAAAFQKRSVLHLRFLLRTRVFNGDWPALPLLCLLYLFPAGKSHAP